MALATTLNQEHCTHRQELHVLKKPTLNLDGAPRAPHALRSSVLRRPPPPALDEAYFRGCHRPQQLIPVLCLPAGVAP